jgi:hypothetical protein
LREEEIVGKSHCICKERPCRCMNGWGMNFQTEQELLDTIDDEIQAQAGRRPGPGNVRAVRWLREEYEYSDEEIAETLGLPLRAVREITRALDTD